MNTDAPASEGKPLRRKGRVLGKTSLAAITGIGLITPLGDSPIATWRSLLDSRYITTHARACINGPDANRVDQLACAVAGQAVEDAGWGKDRLGDARTALLVGTSKGAIETWMTAPPVDAQHMVSWPYVLAGRVQSEGLATTAWAVARSVGHGTGPRLTLSAACASSIHALIRGVLLLTEGRVDRALVVTAESSLHPLFIGSFQRLGVLAKPEWGCRPFDKNRCGFLMSEAAAAVCIERQPLANASSVYARIDRMALAADPHHLTGMDPSAGPLRSVLRSIIDARPVDLVHAHGTGTITNDPLELSGIAAETSYLTNLPVYSHKGALGHSLGSAGLVAVVLNCLIHREGVVPGNTRTSEPLPSEHLVIQPRPLSRPIRRSVALAAGFGGAIGGVSMVAID